MEEDVEKYYKFWERVEKYSWANPKRVQEIKDMIERNWDFFGKRIIDLCCGGGILGILLGRSREYLGVDVNKNMIKEAKRWAKKFKVPAKFVVADVRNVKLEGKWDTFVCIGNSIGHLSAKDVAEMVRNVTKHAKKGAHFIIDYRDVVGLLFRKEWKDVMIEVNEGKRFISVTSGIDVANGFIEKVAFDGKTWMEFKHAIWSPFILETIMEANGWKLVKREKCPEWDGFVDVYRRK